MLWLTHVIIAAILNRWADFGMFVLTASNFGLS
jgi:hypothetical protein